MARIRLIFFRNLQTSLKSKNSGRGWIAKPLLVLMTTFLCIVVSPVLALAPAVKLVGQNLANSQGRTPHLLQQGKTFYEAGQFSEAVKVLQQSSAAFRATGDDLRQAISLSNLSLAYQQLGLWAEAEQAIAQSLNLLQNLDNSNLPFA